MEIGCKCSLTQVCVIWVVRVNSNPQLRINHTQLDIENHSRTTKELSNVDLSHVVVFYCFITIYSFHCSFAQTTSQYQTLFCIELLEDINTYRYIEIYIYTHTFQKSPQNYEPDSHHLFFRSILLG